MTPVQAPAARKDPDAVIVSYNSSEALTAQLASPVLRAAFHRIVVVDNASSDESAAIAEQAGASVLRRNNNGGLAAALNDGLRATASEFIALINPDVLLTDRDLVRRLLKEFDDPRVGLVAPRLQLLDGTDQDSARRVPTPLQLVARRLRGKDYGAIHPRQAANVPWVVFAFVLARRSALTQIGGFDEGYFLYFEDVDTCVRLWKAGWKVRLEPTSVAQHAFQAASRGSLRHSATLHHLRSARHFFRKHPRTIWGRLPFLREPSLPESTAPTIGGSDSVADVARDVTVVILNWNAAAVIGQCLDSLLVQRYGGRVRILVVDNASTDGSLDLLKHHLAPVDVIRLGENVGFARGNNAGFRHVDTDLIVFLNPDTEFVGRDSLARLLEPLRDRSIGLVGPHVLNPDRTTQQSCSLLPSISSLLLAATGVYLVLPDAARRYVAPVVWSHDRSTDTGWVGGSCLAMRSSDFQQVGTFAEATFMYGEDLDLGWRMKQFGKRVRFEHAAKLVHHRDVSSSQRWTPEEVAAKVALGELTFLRKRYSRPMAGVGQSLMCVNLASRAWLLRRLKPDRALVYSHMAAASRLGRTRSQGES